VVIPEFSEDATGPSIITHAEWWAPAGPSCPSGVRVKTFQVHASGAGLANYEAAEPFFFVVP